MDLHEAIEHGNYNAVVLRLQTHPQDLEDPDYGGYTPLMNAAYYGEAKIMEKLICRGANIEATDSRWRTALHIAVQEDHLDVAKLLLKQRASVSVRNNFGWTPLHFASLRGRISHVELLLKNGADINATTNNDQTAINLATQETLDFLKKWQRQEWEKRMFAFCQGLHPRLGRDTSIQRCWTADLSERNLIWLIGLFLKPSVETK